MQGVFAHNGNGSGRRDLANFQPVTIASITDGTSNTFIYGEHAHSELATQNGDIIRRQLVDIRRLRRHHVLLDLSAELLHVGCPVVYRWRRWGHRDLIPTLNRRSSHGRATSPTRPPACIPAEPTSRSATDRFGSSRTRSIRGTLGHLSAGRFRPCGWNYNLNAAIRGLPDALDAERQRGHSSDSY